MISASKIYSRYYTYVKPVIKLPIVRTYGFAILTLITLTILVWYALKPTITTIVVLQKKLDNANQIIAKARKKAKDLTLGKQNYENLDPNIKNKIQTALPDSIQLKTLAQALEDSVKRHDASISALQIQTLKMESKKEDIVGTVVEISFTFNVQGVYQNLILALQDLKRSSRLISIDNLSLSKPNEASNLIMAISGKAYYLK